MFWLIVLFCIGLDQLTKYLVVSHMTLGQSIPVIPNVLHITYVLNEGASFSMLQGQKWLFLVITLAVLIAICCLLRKIPKEEKWLRWSMAVFVGGMLGNFIDRLRQGAVIDFIDIRVFPIWNVADSLLVLSVIAIAILVLRTETKRKQKP
ncbi:MAG: signal peptidase II [Firmicutes bacterium]|nr:signal peptidase II [Bacillota bacterium]